MTAKFDKNFDINRVAQVGVANVEMMQTMHDALQEIARCPVGINGELQQKEIAEAALIYVYATAQNLEENKCLS